MGYQIKHNEMGETYDTYGRKERRLQVFVVKIERKRLLGRTNRRWEDNIRTVLPEIEWEQELD